MSLAGPLVLSFFEKTYFIARWKSIIPAILVPAVFFVVWDIIFTQLNTWSFNPAYIAGWKMLNLPVEEVLFFMIIPYCNIFIYFAMGRFFPGLNTKKTPVIYLAIPGVLSMVMIILYFDRLYSLVTFSLSIILFAVLIFNRHIAGKMHLYRLLISFVVCLFPFLIVNGFLTALPVVQYNNEENMNLRVYTIPLEDFVYAFLLMGCNVIVYEYFEKKRGT